MSWENEEEEYEMEILNQTDKAFLLSDGDIEEWFPKSMIDWKGDLEIETVTTFIIPNWLASEKGLI